MSPRHQICSGSAAPTSSRTASKAWRFPWMSDKTATCICESEPVVGRRIGAPLALIAAVAVAEGAVLLLRPREGVLDSLPVRAGSYFSAGELERARDFRRPQLALYGASLLVEGAVLVLLVRRPPRRLRRRVRRPVAAAAVTPAALSLVLE